MKKRILSMILTLALCLSLLPAVSIPAAAADTSTLVSTISGWNNGLSASASGDTVTVTGTAENVATGLTLNIDSGVTVDWQAALTGGTSSNNFDVLTVTGSGAFTMDSGSITNTYGNGGNGSALKVEGSVRATISGNAAISAPGQTGIDHNSSAAMTVSGGTVLNCNSAIVCGSSGGGALNVTRGEVSGTNGIVIYGGGQVTVSDGTVSGINAGILFQSSTIGDETTPNIVVSGGTVKGIGTPVESDYGHGISCEYPAYISVTGGTVTSEDGTGILDGPDTYSGSNSTTIRISGGTVSSTSTVSNVSYSAIKGSSEGANPTTVILSGTATLSAAGGWGIYGAKTVEIASGKPAVSGALGGIQPFSTSNAEGMITIENGATLTVNGTGTGTDPSSSPGIWLPKAAKLVVNGKLAVRGTRGVSTQYHPVYVTVNSGGLLDAEGTISAGVGIFQHSDGASTVTVDGTLKATGASYGVSANTVTVSEGGVLDASSTGDNALYCAAALNVNSGVLRAASSSSAAYSGHPSTITISGNSHIVFSGTYTPNYGNGTLTLDSGLTDYYWYTGEAKSAAFNHVSGGSGTALTADNIRNSKYTTI